jgi:hypothetical protein
MFFGVENVFNFLQKNTILPGQQQFFYTAFWHSLALYNSYIFFLNSYMGASIGTIAINQLLKKRYFTTGIKMTLPKYASKGYLY